MATCVVRLTQEERQHSIDPDQSPGTWRAAAAKPLHAPESSSKPMCAKASQLLDRC